MGAAGCSGKGSSVDAGTVGLALSCILGAIRIYEFFRGRQLGLSIKTQLTSNPEIGNTVLLLNSSANPINIYCFNLVWLERDWLRWAPAPWRRISSTDSPLDFEYCDITVPPRGQHSLLFGESYHFHWGVRLRHDIYLQLWLVGRRRPVWFHVTSPPS